MKLDTNIQHHSENFALTLPVKPEDLGDFLSSLLGEVQTIEKEYQGRFSVDKNDVLSFYHLLEQRIHQQNEATLVSLSIKVIYNDNSSVSLNSIDSFLEYNEIRKLIPTETILAFTYLVKFNKKDVPERQKININLSSHEEISYRIEHTARTWGGDIDAMLRSHIETILYEHIEKPNPIVHNLYKFGSSIVGWGIFVGSLAASWFITNSFINNQLEKIRSGILLDGDVASINQNILFLGSYLSEGVWARYFFFLIFFLILMGILGLVVEHSIIKRTINTRYGKSFLLFTDAAEKDKEGLEKKIRKAKVHWYWSFALSILSGVMANYAFSYLSTIIIQASRP